MGLAPKDPNTENWFQFSHEAPAIPTRKSVLARPVFTCSKLRIETLEQGVNFENNSHLVLAFRDYVKKTSIF